MTVPENKVHTPRRIKRINSLVLYMMIVLNSSIRLLAVALLIIEYDMMVVLNSSNGTGIRLLAVALIECKQHDKCVDKLICSRRIIVDILAFFSPF